MMKQVQDIINLEKEGIISFEFIQVPIVELYKNPELSKVGEGYNFSRHRLVIGWDGEEVENEETGLVRKGGILATSDDYNKNYDNVEEALEAWLICATNDELLKIINDSLTPPELKTILEEIHEK